MTVFYGIFFFFFSQSRFSVGNMYIICNNNDTLDPSQALSRKQKSMEKLDPRVSKCGRQSSEVTEAAR